MIKTRGVGHCTSPLRQKVVDANTVTTVALLAPTERFELGPMTNNPIMDFLWMSRTRRDNPLTRSTRRFSGNIYICLMGSLDLVCAPFTSLLEYAQISLGHKPSYTEFHSMCDNLSLETSVQMINHGVKLYHTLISPGDCVTVPCGWHVWKQFGTHKSGLNDLVLLEQRLLFTKACTLEMKAHLQYVQDSHNTCSYTHG